MASILLSATGSAQSLLRQFEWHYSVLLDTGTPITGLVGFMGNGDLWGFIISHKSEWGFMGIYGYE